MKITVRFFIVRRLSYAAAPPESAIVPHKATLQYVAYYSEATRRTHLQLVDCKFLISGYGLISLEAQRLTPFLSLGDKSLLQNATINTFLSLNLRHYIRPQNVN
jgi:hypothetical protein